VLTRNAHVLPLSHLNQPRHKEFVIKHSIRQLLPLAAALTLVPAAAFAQGDEEATRSGKLAFNSSCRTCHSLEEGDNRLGPNLHSIIGRQAGSEEYGYSPALQSSEMVWDAATLDRFIETPDAVIPGNNMKPYSGISDEETRAEIVSYLESESGGGETSD
jgi:cytochrome c